LHLNERSISRLTFIFSGKVSKSIERGAVWLHLHGRTGSESSIEKLWVAFLLAVAAGWFVRMFTVDLVAIAALIAAAGVAYFLLKR
jgi:Flp pilus assembly protein TadB